MRIPFDIKYRPQIESREYKVETRDGKPTRIVCWDMDSYNPIVALVANYPNYDGSLSEHIFSYSMDGHYSATRSSDEDLFIVTPEPEMTAFEKKVYAYCDGKTVGEELIKRIAKELLDYARKELEPEVLERLEVAYKNQDEVVYENGKRDGQAEALKDLPRWMKWDTNKIFDDSRYVLIHTTDFNISSDMLLYDTITKRAIFVSDLKKLPGFKED